MVRQTQARVRVARRLGEVLPGLTRKPIDRKPYPPGQHGPIARQRKSEYRVRLEEKQKLRAHYGVNETQLRRYFAHAAHAHGDTGVLLLQALERRLDNVVFRAGFAPTIPAARQLVNHGHVEVNGRKVDIASYALKAGDVVRLRDERGRRLAKEALEQRVWPVPSFLDVDDGELTARFLADPPREDVLVSVREHLIIEHYSR